MQIENATIRFWSRSMIWKNYFTESTFQFLRFSLKQLLQFNRDIYIKQKTNADLKLLFEKIFQKNSTSRRETKLYLIMKCHYRFVILVYNLYCINKLISTNFNQKLLLEMLLSEILLRIPV